MMKRASCPANNSVQQTMLCFGEDEEEKIVPDLTVVIKKEQSAEDNFTECIAEPGELVEEEHCAKAPPEVKLEYSHGKQPVCLNSTKFFNQDILLSEICDIGRVQPETAMCQKNVSTLHSISLSSEEDVNKNKLLSENEEKVLLADTSTEYGDSEGGTACTDLNLQAEKGITIRTRSSVKRNKVATNAESPKTQVPSKINNTRTRNESDHSKSTSIDPESSTNTRITERDEENPEVTNNLCSNKSKAVESLPKVLDPEQNLLADAEIDKVMYFEVPGAVQLRNSLVTSENEANAPSKSERKIFRCDICGKEFHCSENFLKHVKIHTADKPHQCNICRKSFSLLSYLKRHISIHVSESNKLLCQYCCKKYPDATRLRHHQTFVHHNEDRRYSCDICSKRFKVPGALKEHRKIHSEQKEYACEICKACFSSSANLIHHYKTHTTERPYKCSFCERSFSRHRNLKSHFVTHTGEKPFRCQLCSRYFRNLSNLKQHELIHSGQKSSCDICGKTYSRSAYVRLHVARAHTKVKKYSCEMCGENFFTTSELTLHVRSHTGERPFKCDYCPKAFVTASRRDEHSRVHKDFKPFQCDRCALRYYSHKSLKVHVRNHHREETNPNET